MIQLTRLNGTRFYLNAEHIQAIEALPDTHILLTNGQQYVAMEPAEQVADLVLRYQRRVHMPFRSVYDLDDESPTAIAERGTR